MKKTKVGVIGCGYMGQNHCRIYSELPEADFIAASDVLDKNQELSKYHINFSTNFSDILDGLAAVSITAQTSAHYSIANACIERGIHCLIEKPFCASIKEAHNLVDLAKKKNIILMIGYVQRFNPAFQKLRELIGNADILAVESRRMHPPLKRANDVSAVYDLMSHDIDLILSLVKSAPQTIHALGKTVNSRLDHIVAEVKFKSNIIANMTASKISQAPVRELNILCRDRLFRLDLLANALTVFHGTQAAESIPVPSNEPLKAELAHFISCVYNEQIPIITGEDGLRDLDLIEQIERLVKE